MGEHCKLPNWPQKLCFIVVKPLTIETLCKFLHSYRNKGGGEHLAPPVPCWHSISSPSNSN